MAPKRHARPPALPDGVESVEQNVAGLVLTERQRERSFMMCPDKRFWLGFPLDDAWDVYVCFIAQGGQPAVTELRVLPRPRTDAQVAWVWDTLNHGHADRPDDYEEPPTAPEGGLTSRALRGVQLGRAVELAYERLEDWFTRAEPFPSLAGWTDFSRDAAKAPRRPGRKGRDDRFYAEVAAAYVEALRRGSRQPVVDAARALSEAASGTYEATYVRDLLHVARQRELLSRPPKGRAGGELTDKALEALRDKREED